MQVTTFSINEIEQISTPPITPLLVNGANYQQWYVLMATRLDRFGVLESLEYGNLPTDKVGIVRELFLILYLRDIRPSFNCLSDRPAVGHNFTNEIVVRN